MKADVLTIAAIVFVLGLLLSSFSTSEVFQSDAESAQATQQDELALR